MRRHGRSAELRLQPTSCRHRVAASLERREGLRADDEQRARRIRAGQQVGEPAAVDVRDKRDARTALFELPQRLDGHGRPQVGAADADIDDERVWLVLARADFSRPHGFAELEHVLALGTHHCIDVLAVDDQGRRGVRRTSQCGMQHRAVLGTVDRITAEHRRDALAQLQLIGEFGEAREHCGVDALAREIEQQPGCLHGAMREALRVRCEQIACRARPRSRRSGSELGPGGAVGSSCRRHLAR